MLSNKKYTGYFSDFRKRGSHSNFIVLALTIMFMSLEVHRTYWELALDVPHGTAYEDFKDASGGHVQMECYIPASYLYLLVSTIRYKYEC